MTCPEVLSLRSKRLLHGRSKPGNIQINIYNELGQQIRELINKEISEGFHKVVWDGKNKFGMSVSSGTYYARIIKNGTAKSIKMILMK